MSGWQPTPATALLILDDGTRLEGRGIGAVGHAAGEVCFNTAMTGYQEILTDPSYAGQIVTFTFPHIGNVGTNDEDIETVNMAALSGVRGVVLKADITNPANYRAAERLDAWLKKRNIVGITGIDTRALTARIREKGMPNGVVAHAPDGYFHEPSIVSRAQELPRPRGPRPRQGSDDRADLQMGPDPVGVGRGLRHAGEARVPHRRDRLRRQAQHPAAARRRGRAGDRGAGDGDGQGHPRAQSRRHLPQQRPGRSGGDRQVCRADDQDADGDRQADLRHLPRPPAARPRARRHDRARCIRATTAPIIRSRT